MSTIFEVSADDITLLSDEDLRFLVARLCESELREKGISPTCVTWGGNQNAQDGGLDVRVTLPAKVEIDGAIPRADTGFQVKAEDTPPSKIESEMRPGGVLRSSIQELVASVVANDSAPPKSFIDSISPEGSTKPSGRAIQGPHSWMG